MPALAGTVGNNPRVVLDIRRPVLVFRGGRNEVITGLALGRPRPCRHDGWLSRGGVDAGKRYRIAAYLELDEGVLDAGAVLVEDGQWILRLGLFDGLWVDLHRLVPRGRRLEVGRVARELAQPALRRVNGHVR